MALHYSVLDRFIMNCDLVVRTVLGNTTVATRPSPAGENNPTLTAEEQRQSAGLMRVNHTGEVCAQALYQGQALTARSHAVRDQMQTAAQEEVDHLAWCQKRLYELNSHTSYLNPVWYVGSLAIGVTAGLLGDRWSLGFLAETEIQVERHLGEHLQKLPKQDMRSRQIVAQMRQEEQQHATLARQLGADELPGFVKVGMSLMSKCMTKITYWV